MSGINALIKRVQMSFFAPFHQIRAQENITCTGQEIGAHQTHTMSAPSSWASSPSKLWQIIAYKLRNL